MVKNMVRFARTEMLFDIAFVTVGIIIGLALKFGI